MDIHPFHWVMGIYQKRWLCNKQIRRHSLSRNSFAVVFNYLKYPFRELAETRIVWSRLIVKWNRRSIVVNQPEGDCWLDVDVQFRIHNRENGRFQIAFGVGVPPSPMVLSPPNPHTRLPRRFHCFHSLLRPVSHYQIAKAKPRLTSCRLGETHLHLWRGTSSALIISISLSHLKGLGSPVSRFNRTNSLSLAQLNGIADCR